MARKELGPDELARLGAAGLCERAAREVALELPQVRTCRYFPTVCEEAVAAWQATTCPLVFEPLARGDRQAQILWEQQQECGG